MKTDTKCFVVLVTAPDLKTARALASSVLNARLAACANLVPKIESHYWWQGKLEKEEEVLLVLKTSQTTLNALQAKVVAEHPYDTPEFLALAVETGHPGYLDWVMNCGQSRDLPLHRHD